MAGRLRQVLDELMSFVLDKDLGRLRKEVAAFSSEKGKAVAVAYIAFNEVHAVSITSSQHKPAGELADRIMAELSRMRNWETEVTPVKSQLESAGVGQCLIGVMIVLTNQSKQPSAEAVAAITPSFDPSRYEFTSGDLLIMKAMRISPEGEPTG